MPASDLARVRSRARAVLNNEGFVPADELRNILRSFLEASGDEPGASETSYMATALPMNKDLRALARRVEELEQALLRQETELSFSQRISRMGSWSYDLSTNEIWWSEEMCRLFGFEQGETELDFAQFFDRLHPEDRDSWLKAVEEASQHGHEYEIHFRALLPGGMIRHLLGKGTADFGEDGGVWRVFGTVQELSEALAPSAGKEGAEEDTAALIAAEVSPSPNRVTVRAGRKPGAVNGVHPASPPPASSPVQARGRVASSSKPRGGVGSGAASQSGSRAEIPPAPAVAAPDPDDPAAARILADQSSQTSALDAGSFPEIHSMIGMWELDLRAGKMNWSGSMTSLLALPPEAPPSLDGLLTLLTDSSRQDFESALQRTVLSGEGFFMQVSLVPQGQGANGQSGEPRLCLVSARLQGHADQEGDYKLLGTIQNVTGWAQA